ncbi:hypothetical protein [Vibrio crassostreae]|uniref:hypothetical protein n=1 Tax=Vibrio crassostreae TaxID=246167 RepID=UPI001B304112|nr:hypothetical protein [Vibrio crassostreae]
MAAIEKICELSEEYEGWAMYGYKRNHIQVLPKHRHRFRCAKAVLHIFKPEKYMARFSRLGTSMSAYNVFDMENYSPPFANEKEYIEYKKDVERCHVVDRFDYALVVEDKELQGSVDGVYMECSINISAVKRRLKRLTRNYQLPVIHHDCSYHEWRENNK